MVQIKCFPNNDGENKSKRRDEDQDVVKSSQNCPDQNGSYDRHGQSLLNAEPGVRQQSPRPRVYLVDKLEIVPAEAEAVRTIFSLYLELGSMGALLAELDRRGIGTKVNGRRDGHISGV